VTDTNVLAPLSLADFEQAIASKPDTLEVHLDLVERDIEVEGCKVHIHCHCLKVDADGRVSPVRLAEFMRSAVIDYAIPHEARQRAKDRDNREGGSAATIELYHRALGTFTDLKTSGEGGELLLYLLAERFLNLPQIPLQNVAQDKCAGALPRRRWRIRRRGRRRTQPRRSENASAR
jgi:hypothetical protein